MVRLSLPGSALLLLPIAHFRNRIAPVASRGRAPCLNENRRRASSRSWHRAWITSPRACDTRFPVLHGCPGNPRAPCGNVYGTGIGFTLCNGHAVPADLRAIPRLQFATDRRAHDDTARAGHLPDSLRRKRKSSWLAVLGSVLAVTLPGVPRPVPSYLGTSHSSTALKTSRHYQTLRWPDGAMRHADTLKAGSTALTILATQHPRRAPGYEAKTTIPAPDTVGAAPAYARSSAKKPRPATPTPTSSTSE